ncbi:MAG: hypothetical protein Q9222_007804, partial [Ikaeria aurantiellina]
MSISPGGQKHIEVTTSLLLLAAFTVLLRFASRRRARIVAGADDWTILIALVLVGSLYIDGLVWVKYGGIGKHFTRLSPSETILFFKCYFASWTIFTAAFALTKVSILLLYVRIFPLRRFRVACAVVGSAVSALSISSFVVAFLDCRPLRYFWDKSVVGGSCLPNGPVLYGIAVPILLLNTAVICLPLPVIWGLQLKLGRKIALMANFLIGG